MFDWFGIAATALLLVICVIHLIACARRQLKIRYITKIFIMPFVALVYIFCARSTIWPVLAAFLFGWLGDIFLIFPESKTAQKLGIISFALGHAFYIGSMHFLFVPLETWKYIVISAVALLIAAVFYYTVAGIISSKMRVLSVVYYLLLASVIAGSGLIYAGSNPAGAFMFAGSILFIYSDTHIVKRALGNKEYSDLMSALIMLTYILAQCLLCFGFILCH